MKKNDLINKFLPKEDTKNEIECPHCFNINKRISIPFGTFCSFCSKFIEPEVETPIIKKGKQEKEIAYLQIKQMIRKRYAN